ncbi:MAG: hypothetical protein BWZ07_01745 [Alphaproteobacteria bacterium ADurb.BinA280]|nr:MAG: hypothetical protein BWZ07_01745 [Alphaproteobacteria bacterium ADurb.BinA280]
MGNEARQVSPATSTKRMCLAVALLTGSSKNLSFPRRRESSVLILLGFRFRGNDESGVFRGALTSRGALRSALTSPHRTQQHSSWMA